MARSMALPKIGVNMTEAVITQWLVKVNDQVKEGDAILIAETDKSSQEIYATDSGVVAGLLVEEGDTVPCYADILMFGEADEALPEAEAKTPLPVAKQGGYTPPVQRVKPGKVRISPLAKKMAREAGIPLNELKPSVAGARIVKADVLRYMENRPAEKCACAENGAANRTPLTQTRKVIAQRMLKSHTQIPTAALTTTVNAQALLALRAKFKEKDLGKLSFDAMLVRVVAGALKRHPMMNAQLEGDEVLTYDEIHMGVAVDTKKGLMVPVVRNVGTLSLFEIGEEVSALSARAIEGTLGAEEMSGSTFTLTNLGMFGVEQFTPLINPPECCILAVGAIKKRFVPDEDDQPVVEKSFQMTLVFDHRIVDGAPAARFLKAVKDLAETPELLL